MAWDLLSESSCCASSQSPDDRFPNLVIPTGHIMTFNNTEREAHKSSDKNRGYLCTGVFFFLCCESSWISIWQTIDTFPMRQENWTTQGLLCDVCVPFAISGIWCSLNQMPLKSFRAPVASWRVCQHLTLQPRTRSSSVTGPRGREPRGQCVVRDPLWSLSFHYHTVSCLLACYGNEVGRGDKDCWLIDRWYYSRIRFNVFTVFRKELHSSWLQYWNSFMNSI